MPNGLISGMAWLAGLGLAQVLLWVLTFAVVFAVLTKAKIFGRAPAALISIVAGIFVLLAVPATLISVISSMSTGLVVIAIAVVVLVALIEVAGAKWVVQTEKGPGVMKEGNWLTGHTTAVAAVLLVLTGIVFFMSGGAALIGIGIPTFGWATWLLILVGIAVLWMLSETK